MVYEDMRPDEVYTTLIRINSELCFIWVAQITSFGLTLCEGLKLALKRRRVRFDSMEEVVRYFVHLQGLSSHLSITWGPCLTGLGNPVRHGTQIVVWDVQECTSVYGHFAYLTGLDFGERFDNVILKEFDTQLLIFIKPSYLNIERRH